MNLRFSNLLLTGLVVVLFASCSSKSNIPIPEDAAFVLHIDGASLSSKLPWDEVKQSELFKLAIEEAKDSLVSKILNNSEESGINIFSDTYLFAKTRGKGGYAAIVCNLKDVTKFEAFLKQIIEDKKIETKDGISIVASYDNIVTWKKDRLVFIANTGGISAGMDDESQNFTTDSLTLFANEIYNLKKNKSIGSNSKFSALLKEKGDMHMWVNAGSLYGTALPGVLMSLTKASLLFNDNITTATINFEDGKITYKGKNYFNKEITSLYKKYSQKEFDETLLQQIPAGSVDAFLAFSYPPEGLKDFFALLGVDGLLNIFLAQSGFSVEEFVKANKGELLLSVADFKVERKEVKEKYGEDEEFTFSTETPSAKILFVTTIKEKVAFEKMIGVFKETISKEAGGIGADEMLSKIPYKLTDKWFVAGNDSAAIQAFGTATTKHPFIEKIKGHPICGYFNIQNFIKGAKPVLQKDSTSLIIADRSLQLWEDIIFYGGEFKGDALVTYAEVNMTDKKTNSLKQLNDYFGFIAKKMRDEEKKKRESYDLMDDMEPTEIPKDKL